ncbi:uncharacterized protein LOC111629146 isoform X1 [Centruroides sculpturatus]|uniref:uncharacterized protein LOC111629146 isoform X1 n=1 Tax=Centruroides sculpturatus TaxID=218467 RepID=UPI000C6CA821|nr:uncharacterized protein LOC111629146 isoform X1 [Centruroides sculpturatus]
MIRRKSFRNFTRKREIEAKDESSSKKKTEQRSPPKDTQNEWINEGFLQPVRNLNKRLSSFLSPRGARKTNVPNDDKLRNFISRRLSLPKNSRLNQRKKSNENEGRSDVSTPLPKPQWTNRINLTWRKGKVTGGKQWNVAAMERYLRDRAEEESVKLGIIAPMTKDQKPESVDTQNEDGGLDEASSPSWTSSCEQTPSYNSSDLTFEFGQKCDLNTNNLEENKTKEESRKRSRRILRREPRVSSPQLKESLSTDRLENIEPNKDERYWSNQLKLRKNSADNAEQLKLRKNSADNTEKMSVSRSSTFSRLLRRTQSAGCTKDVPAHALFLRDKRPVSKTKSADSASSTGIKDDDEKKHKKKLSQDTKLRLTFLRRRHTDSSIQNSVRPSPEEAQKWADSFQDLMSSKYGQALFRAFLSREFSEENIEFWLACEDFKKARTNKLSSKARKIYNDFVASQSPKEVNLDLTIRNSIMNSLATPDRHSFDQAQRRIQALMEQDSYLRFLQSELYLELLQCSDSR